MSFVKESIMAEAIYSPDLPIFLFGESMGGAVAVRMAQIEGPKLFAGFMLYSPMLSLEMARELPIGLGLRNGHLEPFATCLSAVVPALPIAKPARNELNPLAQLEMDEDELSYGGDVRARCAAEFVAVTNGFMDGGLGLVDVPFMTMHSVKDTFTDPLGSERLYRDAKTTDKEYLKVGPGETVDVDLWHAFGNGDGFEVPFKFALEWFEKHC